MHNHGLGSWTARRARKTPEALAVLHQGARLSYTELHDRATRSAHYLRRLGVRSGDRVAFLGPNHPALLETLFAAGMLGAVFVPLNTRLSDRELRHCLDDAGAEMLVHDPAYGAVVSRSWRHHVPIDEVYERIVAEGPAEAIDEPVGLGDPCLIMYTSGTTGQAKGAVLTHGNITWNSVNVLVDTDLAHDEVTLVSAPMFHTAALNMTCLPTLLKGGTVILEPSFDPARTLELIARHRVTMMFGVPAMYQALAKVAEFGEADLTSVRRLLCGGAPVPAALVRSYLDRGIPFIQGYGMTETSPGVLLLDGDHAASKAGTAGVPHFFTDVRVTDPDGRAVATGAHGELWAEGPNVTPGYWGLPEATAQTLSGGWFRSGDVATSDEDGYFRIVDRIKDMIISGGENIYPAEVEEVLHAHAAVAECAVIAVPDDRWGEVGRAVVVLHPGIPQDKAIADELLEFLADRLARYKVPKSVVFAGRLPRGGSGKVLKARLRDAHSS